VIGRAELDTFRERLRETIARFEREEAIHRAQWVGAEVPEAEQDDLLERATRRYLIDPILDALDWSPNDPNLITEERRSWADNGDRLYFDYLGVDQAHNPLLLVEAKGYDTPAPRGPHAPTPDRDTVRRMIAAAIGALNAGTAPRGVLKAWVEWLKDLRTYVRSLVEPARASLQRVVITAGRWLIVIEGPAAVFDGHEAPEIALIHAFLGFDDILADSDRFYALLHRSFLADTLPLALSLQQAIEVLAAASIEHVARGVIVRTRRDGFQADEFVRRVVAPVVVLVSGSRAFAIREAGGTPLAEPEDATALGGFLARLTERGDQLEQLVRQQLDLGVLPLTTLSQFPRRALEAPAMPAVAPAAGSTAARVATVAPDQPQLVRSIVHRDEPPEYIVVTGRRWFYKLIAPNGPDCPLHDWLAARANQRAEAERHVGPNLTSFTASGDSQHCADSPMRGHRARAGCQVGRLETHLCCRACVFDDVCWTSADRPRLSCP
jgi:hypothetical protein